MLVVDELMLGQDEAVLDGVSTVDVAVVGMIVVSFVLKEIDAQIDADIAVGAMTAKYQIVD